MAFTFIKFPKKFLDSEEWQKPRKYSKAEALLYLLHKGEYRPSIRQLADLWGWKKSTVQDFVSYAMGQGYIGQSSDKVRTQSNVSTNELHDCAGQDSDKIRTHNKEHKNYPPVLSTTNVVSNTIPPKGGSESNFLQEVSDEFREVILDWLAYKRERRESYKSHRSMRAFYNKLKTLSQNDPSVAREIIEQSMANNWAGIFQLKNDDTKRTTNTPSNDPSARLEGVLRAAAEGIARARTPQEWESRAVGI